MAKPATALKLPKEIVLVISVEDLPGIKTPKSFWEAAYDIRIADWNSLIAKPELAELPEAGDSLLQSSAARRSLLAESDRQLEISIPITGALADRLKKQTSNPQVFFLRSTIRIFDAELDRQYALKLNRLWQFKLFPDGRATIAIKINSDGSYSTFGPTPKVLPPGYSIIGRPSDPASVRNP
ncbi:MAG TPA: hypothetical protein VGO68_02555 [Pyrinomonadaceae bacterium]|jgi:hypothetical protein|nr:hypothetical protein [Pyrinomonadaceae bacterium]